jgi:uncharacterized membrane protein YeaQ/YmgE (transglycosylase-associated protein family)
MPDVSIVFDIVRFLAPGLLFMQVLYLSGTHKGSDSEWVIRGIILGIPVRWVGTKLVTSLGLETNPGLTFEVYLLAVALAGGLVVAFINRLLLSEDVVTED